MTSIYSLFIINKSGGLIFYKDYGSTGRLDTNDSLRLASLWHSMHAISLQLSPTLGCAGIDLLQADTFDLHCFQALTGTFSSPSRSYVKPQLNAMFVKKLLLGLQPFDVEGEYSSGYAVSYVECV